MSPSWLWSPTASLQQGGGQAAPKQPPLRLSNAQHIEHRSARLHYQRRAISWRWVHGAERRAGALVIGADGLIQRLLPLFSRRQLLPLLRPAALLLLPLHRRGVSCRLALIVLQQRIQFVL